MFQKIRSVAGGVIFLLLCAGGALAMPTAFNAEPEEEVTSTLDEVELEPADAVVDGETTEVTVPADEEDEGDGPESSESSETSDKAVNHGKAVSTAAHCDLKGRAKGQLVSSVARDKTATAESAQAACEAAMAAQEAAPAKAKPAKPGHAAKPAKPAKPAKAPKAPKAPKTVEAPDAQDATATPPARGGPPASAAPSGKGNSKKP